MSRIAPDYSPFGYRSDPMSGDVDAIAAQTAHLRTIAEQMFTAEKALHGVSGDGQVSERLDVIVSDVASVRGKLALVQSRYAGAAGALEQYRAALQPDQAAADAVVRQHSQDVQTEKTQNARAWDLFGKATANLLNPVAFAPINEEYNSAKASLNATRNTVASAKSQLAGLIANRKQNQKQAAAAIRAAADQSGLNDTVLDYVQKIVDNAKQWLIKHSESLTFIGEVLGWVSVALALASIVFPVLAPVAAVLGGIAGLFTLVGGLGKALKDGDWGKFALTAGLSVLSVFGAAKALKGVAQISKLGGLSPLKAMAAYGRAPNQLTNVVGHDIAKVKGGWRAILRGDKTLVQRSKGLITVGKTVPRLLLKDAPAKIGAQVLEKLGLRASDATILVRAAPILKNKIPKFVDWVSRNMWAQQTQGHGCFETHHNPVGVMH